MIIFKAIKLKQTEWARPTRSLNSFNFINVYIYHFHSWTVRHLPVSNMTRQVSSLGRLLSITDLRRIQHSTVHVVT